ncbi:hypothetical protein LOCC1_G008614, partial [Lachnellula occidentalis]
GLPDLITYNTSKNFVSTKFRSYIKAIAIDVKVVPIKAYNSIEKIKLDLDVALQIAIKYINNIASLDSIILILFVFRAYPRMTRNLLPLATIIQRAKAIQRATKEVRRLYAKRKVVDILVIRNRPNT